MLFKSDYACSFNIQNYKFKHNHQNKTLKHEKNHTMQKSSVSLSKQSAFSNAVNSMQTTRAPDLSPVRLIEVTLLQTGNGSSIFPREKIGSESFLRKS